MVKKRKNTAPQEEGAPDVTTEEMNQVLLASSKAKQAAGDAAALTLEILQSTTTGLVRRCGWFRDVRIRRAADGFMRGCKLYQQAWERDGDSSRPFQKPSHSQIQEYEQQLRDHIQALLGRMKVVPMNDRREIKLKPVQTAKPAVAQKLQEMKDRAEELQRKPKSVIKAGLRKKRKAGSKSKAKTKGQEAGAAEGSDEDV